MLCRGVNKLGVAKPVKINTMSNAALHQIVGVRGGGCKNSRHVMFGAHVISHPQEGAITLKMSSSADEWLHNHRSSSTLAWGYNKDHMP